MWLVITLHPRGDITLGWVTGAVVMVMITITTVVGNSVVVIAVKRARRVPSHYPLASLAAADLLVGTTVLPIATARELFIFNLPYPICATWSTLDVLCCTASILSLCALGWERWCGITDPLARAKRTHRAKVSAILVWPVSILVAIPTAFIPSPRHFIPEEMAKACTVNTNVGYVFASISLSFYIPASVMLCLYARIIRALSASPQLRSHRGRTPTCADAVINITSPNKSSNQQPQLVVVPSAENDGSVMTPDKMHIGQPPGKQTSTATPQIGPKNDIVSRQRRATSTIVKLMMLFLFCWTPFFVMLPVDSLCQCIRDLPWLWCTWLGYANSALNPLVYAAGSPSVRRALRDSFTSSGSARTTDVPLTPCVRRA